MTTLSIRGLDEQTVDLLKQEAKRRGVSMNGLVLQLIKRGIGQQSTEPRLATYHDLDHLAGTWTAEEAAAFAQIAQDFERIDSELWQ